MSKQQTSAKCKIHCFGKQWPQQVVLQCVRMLKMGNGDMVITKLQGKPVKIYVSNQNIYVSSS